MRDATLFEFDSAEKLLAAADALRALGVTELETYTPFAIPALDSRLGVLRTRIPRAVLAAGLVGAAVAFAILWGTNAHDYPLNVGGRPVNSLPADIPIVFETAVLFAAATTFVSVLVRSGLPRLHHPILEVDGIESASLDRFWIGVPHAHGALPGEPMRAKMRELGALSVHETKGGR